MDVLTPGTAADLAAELRACSDKKSAVCLGGAFTKDRQGGPLPEPAVRISTSSLNRLLKYEPNDLTISVEAGMKWNALARLLVETGQMLPLDPPWFDEATVGGVIASNLCGPRRRLFGSARDAVIGMSYATTEGKLVVSGGMVVKNVAGLDLAKLMIGSLGTLAAITSVNFKLSPRAAGARTFALADSNLATLFQRRDELLGSVLHPAAIDIVNSAAAARLDLPAMPHLLVEAVGSESVLKRFAAGLSGFETIDDRVWIKVREWIPAWLADNPGGCIVRVSDRHSELAGLMSGAAGPAVARAGNGVLYVGTASPAETRVWRTRAVVEFAPAAGRRDLDLWPDPGDALPLMKQVKAMYDPQNVLNPGRFYGRF